MKTLQSCSIQPLEKDRYQRLLECSKALPWELKLPDCYFSYIGPQVVNLFGYPISDWHKPGFWESKIHPNDRVWAPTFCKNATARMEDHSFEYRMLKADGSVIWIRDDVTIIIDDAKPIALQGFMFDITEQKQAEGIMDSLASSGSIHKTDEFFRDCVRILADLYTAKFAFIGLLNADKKSVTTFTVWAEGEYMDNFTYDLEGTPCKDILDLTKKLIPREAAKKYPDDQKLSDMQVESYYGAPLISSNKSLLGLVSVMDIKPMEPTTWSAPILGVFATRIAVELERKFALESLNKLNETLEQRVDERTNQLAYALNEMESFSYSVSHDLRSPLRSIDGYSMAILEDYHDQLDDTAQGYLDRIRSNAQFMGELIDDLLNLSRISRCNIQSEDVSLSDMATKVFSKLHQSNHDRNISFINNNAFTVNCDPNLLRILLENLLGNAFKYTKNKTVATIELGLIQKKGKIVHFIKDNGTGFDMKYINKLFTPFQRLHDPSTFKGNGIGLATVKRILQRHNSKIWADAELDKGATFYFTLPSNNALLATEHSK